MRYPDGRYFDDYEVLNDLSRPLQLELREHQCQKVLSLLRLSPGSRTSHLLSEHLHYRTFVSVAFSGVEYVASITTTAQLPPNAACPDD